MCVYSVNSLSREECGHVLRAAETTCQETAGDLQIAMWTFIKGTR